MNTTKCIIRDMETRKITQRYNMNIIPVFMLAFIHLKTNSTFSLTNMAENFSGTS